MKAGARGRPAGRVAAGILVTRILGLVRERVFAHYFGSGHEADAFRAALRIPNIIRNLLGEGTLAASFIPVYASMLERDDEDAAQRLSSVVASLLVIVAVVGAAFGVVLAPIITDLVALGFDDPTRDLTIGLVRILFPMAGGNPSSRSSTGTRVQPPTIPREIRTGFYRASSGSL